MNPINSEHVEISNFTLMTSKFEILCNAKKQKDI